MALGSEHDLEVVRLKTKHSGFMWFLCSLTLAAYLGNMGINYLGALGYFGETNEQVSAKYPTILTPAGYAFSIWIVIFSLQGLYTLYALLPGDDDKLPYIALLGAFVPLGWVSESLWTLAFNNELLPASLILITSACFFFMIAYLRITDPQYSLQLSATLIDLFSGLQPGSTSVSLLLKKVWYYLIFHVPTALNFGWLVVASLVDGLIVLKSRQVEVPVPYALAILVALNVVAVFFMAWRRDVVVALVQVWAIPAIAAEHLSDPILVSACHTSAGLLAALVAVTVLLNLITAARPHAPPPETTGWVRCDSKHTP